MFYALLTFPSATTTIQEAANYANPWITEFLPLIGIGLGLFCFGLLVPWLFGTIKNAITGAFTTHQIKKSSSFEDFSDHYLTDTGHIRIFRKK